MRLDQTLKLVANFLATIYDFVSKFITYQVTIGGTTIPLWNILAVVGVGIIVTALILKIIL